MYNFYDAGRQTIGGKLVKALWQVGKSNLLNNRHYMGGRHQTIAIACRVGFGKQ